MSRKHKFNLAIHCSLKSPKKQDTKLFNCTKFLIIYPKNHDFSYDVSMLKIALIGYGKMGKMIEQTAPGRQHQIVSIIDPGVHNKEITKESISEADVCIEFTHPDSVLDNIERVLSLGKSIVVGTTGWTSQMATVERWVKKSNSGLFYASNFSIGVNLFFRLIEKAASLYLNREMYDVSGLEIHHSQKADAPSGTAIELQQILSNQGEKEIPPFTSIRCGATPGTHTILFDSCADTITLTHRARNREGFALGALMAAEWLQNRKGIFNMKDFLCLQ